MLPTVYFIIPCYYDEEVLPETSPIFLKKLKSLIDETSIKETSRILFVNDGSTDGTWAVIKALCNQNKSFVGMTLSDNYGEQNALLAGMSEAIKHADCVITMDSDLQDDINVIDIMLEKFVAGFDIVMGVRSSREGDTLKERFFSACFYEMMRILRTGLVKNHSNCRLMSKEAATELVEDKTSSFFLPAYVSNMPFRKTAVSYVRSAREHGKSGYNFSKKMKMAISAAVLHSETLKAFPGNSNLRRKNLPRYQIKELYPAKWS